MRPGPSRDSPVAFVSAADKSNRYRYRISSHGSGVDHLAISSAFCGPASRKPLSAAPARRPHPFLDANTLFVFGVSMDQPRCKREWKRIVAAITEHVAQGFSRQAPIFMTGGILRDMRHPAPDAVDQPRSAHIRRCGIQRQIGFDVVAPRLFSIAPLPAPPLLL